MLLIAYDLIKPNESGSDYGQVSEGIKSAYPGSVHIERSVFLVETEQAAHTCYVQVQKLLPVDNLRLFVGEIDAADWWASRNPDDDINNLLQ